MIIRSGGQNGADIGAILAAYDLGVKTTGIMPRGFRTLDGPKPEYVKYGMIDSAIQDYRYRTYENVRLSDATLRIAKFFDSPGEICTLNAIRKYGKKNFDVLLDGFAEESYAFESVIKWIQFANIQELNVAGNSEQTCPGIQDFVYKFMTNVLKGLL